MKALLEALRSLASYKNLIETLKSNNTPVLITGVVSASEPPIICAAASDIKAPALIITDTPDTAARVHSDLLLFCENALLFPARDNALYTAAFSGGDTARSRLKALHSLIKGEAPAIVMPAEALPHRLAPKSAITSAIITLRPGGVFPMDALAKQLVLLGYDPAADIDGPGQFSRRGGILDIYPALWDNPLRVEFWDDEIDSIRLLDAETLRSIEKITEAEIFPVKEVILDEAKIPSVEKHIMRELENRLSEFQKSGNPEAAERLEAHVSELLRELSHERRAETPELLTDYFYPKPASVLDWIPENTVIYVIEPARAMERMSAALESFRESMALRAETGYVLPSRKGLLMEKSEILRRLSGRRMVLMNTIRGSVPDFSIKREVSITAKPTAFFRRRLDLFCGEIASLKKEKYKTVILSKSRTLGERLIAELADRGTEGAYSENISELLPGGVYAAKGTLSRGFLFPDARLAVFTDYEVMGETKKRPLAKKRKNARAIESFTELYPSDYVVHETYGIGIFQGLENITVDGISKDYLKISYAGGDCLHVAVSQMDLIQKYIGSEGAAPRLSRMGGADWERAKAKARHTVAILAADLVELYAKREAAKGFRYSPDTIWQKEFEESFPYEETEDQLVAIEDVKSDMEGPGIMDRLICGDVGYGKTEVAIRAAFKAVQDSRQTAILVPTTILAEQHFVTFTERMNDYPIRIEVLSRFRPPKEQKAVIERLSRGETDIVIGTHRLLSGDVRFKNLGLIVIDEEQRFGVAHKEKLKRIRENVDVLALSATPIPRTLHMSLAGIRDMSILNEPPRERRPIQTYVMEYDLYLVRDAIKRELARGGQVYYLHNRVINIAETVLRLQNLIPEAAIAYAHGKMTERELSSIMKSFLERETDVLVCTTIIESGIDIPNVNTIIIQDADKMGLSQLYQLRGRVGRSNVVAYAYMLYRKDKAVSEEAEKRLKTIKEFTEFGAGFKIAMKDLEIRGAGTLLGAEQHGTMDVVGYEMYCKLLKEAVDRIKGDEPAEEAFETAVDLGINAFIPEYYIRNQESRLGVYKRIAMITNQEEYFDVQEEIEDKYGDPPRAVQKLLELVHIKANAHRAGVLSITEKNGRITLKFRENAPVDIGRIMGLIIKEPQKYMVRPDKSFELMVKKPETLKKGPDSLEYLKNLLQALDFFE